jgi:carboxylesterase
VVVPIISGAEPWSAGGGTHGVLVLHGFTGNPQSLRNLAEAVAASGFTVELPLLPGHGTSIDDMLPTRWEDWRAAAEAEYRSLAARCERVVVSGLSMGGTLTCWLAERHPEIAGIAVVNPLIQAPDQEFRQGVAAMVEAGTEVFDAIGSDIKKEGAVEAAYRARLGEIHCPTLLFSSREDHVVDPVSGDVLAGSVGGPLERIHLENSYHVATLDGDAALIEERVVEFAVDVMGGPGTVAR